MHWISVQRRSLCSNRSSYRYSLWRPSPPPTIGTSARSSPSADPWKFPGKVLPAGTYTFKLASTLPRVATSFRFSIKNGSHLFATILALPDYRTEATGRTVVQFEERAAGSPEAIKAWFYPGDNYGIEFVYPHDEAAAIAKRTNQNVLSMPNEMGASTDPEAMKNAEVNGVDPTGAQIDSKQVAMPKKEK